MLVEDEVVVPRAARAADVVFELVDDELFLLAADVFVGAVVLVAFLAGAFVDAPCVETAFLAVAFLAGVFAAPDFVAVVFFFDVAFGGSAAPPSTKDS